jgi:hypothetical protein
VCDKFETVVDVAPVTTKDELESQEVVEFGLYWTTYSVAPETAPQFRVRLDSCGLETERLPGVASEGVAIFPQIWKATSPSPPEFLVGIDQVRLSL